MDEIQRIIRRENLKIQHLFHCAEIVRSNGDVIVLKLDGERSTRQYTVFITIPKSNAEIIRSDSDSLEAAILDVLQQYLLVKADLTK